MALSITFCSHQLSFFRGRQTGSCRCIKFMSYHRNLLQSTHKEFGSSNDGRYWTQNFGGGEEFLVHPDFPE